MSIIFPLCIVLCLAVKTFGLWGRNRLRVDRFYLFLDYDVDQNQMTAFVELLQQDSFLNKVLFNHVLRSFEVHFLDLKISYSTDLLNENNGMQI